MLVNEHAEYPKPDEDHPLGVALFPGQERHDNAFPSTPPPQKVVLFCLFPGQVRHLEWWLTKYFADHVDIFHMYAEMGNDERTEMQFKLQDWHNPSVLVMTPKVGRTDLNHTGASHTVITEKLLVQNKQQWAFVRVVQLRQSRVPQTWLLNTGPGSYDTRANNVYQHSAVAQIRVLYGLRSGLNIMT